MPDMPSALHALLVADAAVSALIGNRAYPINRPQGSELPALRYQVVSDARPQDLDDYETARETRVQIDCFGKSYKAARQLAEAVIAATSEPDTVAGIVFGRIKAEGPRDLGEDVDGKGFIHRASMDLLVWHRLA